jgi:hypothetical protein
MEKAEMPWADVNLGSDRNKHKQIKRVPMVCVIASLSRKFILFQVITLRSPEKAKD